MAAAATKPKRKSGNTLSAVATTGAGTTVDFGIAPVRDVRYFVKSATVTSGGTIKFECSHDGTTWYVHTSLAVSATGNTAAHLTTAGTGAARYWRANLTARTDGTYTVDLSGDSDAV